MRGIGEGEVGGVREGSFEAGVLGFLLLDSTAGVVAGWAFGGGEDVVEHLDLSLEEALCLLLNSIQERIPADSIVLRHFEPKERLRLVQLCHDGFLPDISRI